MGQYYIYIVLSRSNTVISKLIHFIKKDKYTHAAISLDKSFTEMYSFGRKQFYNPFIGGFNIEKFNKGIYKYHKTLPGAIIELEVTKEQLDKVNRLLNQFKLKRDQYKYNYRGLLHSLFGQEINYNNCFLCSEFVYYILNESGIIDLNIARNLVRPQHFIKLDGNIIYEGNLKEIHSLNLQTSNNKIKKIQLYKI